MDFQPGTRLNVHRLWVKSMSERNDLIPAALYARVSSDRQDVDLPVVARMRALRDSAERIAAIAGPGSKTGRRIQDQRLPGGERDAAAILQNRLRTRRQREAGKLSP